jgi:hypothetical protein
MSRKELTFSQEKISPFELEAFVKKAVELNQRTIEAFTTTFLKRPPTDGYPTINLSIAPRSRNNFIVKR